LTINGRQRPVPYAIGAPRQRRGTD